MKLKTMTGQYRQTDHGLVMTVKNYSTTVTLAYGDVVILDTTNNDSGIGIIGVARTTVADSTSVIGVICQPGGILPGGVGDLMVLGIADVNVVSAAYAIGAYLGTSATAGSAATGTYARGSSLGKVLYNAGGSVTTTVAYICIC